MNVFDIFTDEAKRVLLQAEEEARFLKHRGVGTEHLLLALMGMGSGVVPRAIALTGQEPARIRQEILRLSPAGRGEPKEGFEYTPLAKTVLQLAIEEARQIGQNFVSAEHLLLGLLREREGVAARALANLGVDAGQLRQKVLELLAAEPGAGEKAKTALDEFGTDLTRMAREHKLDPVVGREEEIERVIQILSRRTKNNPCLVGEPGVGKTAIVEGLAQKIEAGQVPEILKGQRVISLAVASLVAGTKFRGEFEERIKKVVDEIRAADDIVLFIDELHTLVGAGAAEGAIDAANILKPALARGELQAIGATTLDEYRKHIEKDPALERRFQPVTVDEPTIEETIEILKGLKDPYEAHHKVVLSPEALEAAARLSARYVTDRFLPDKAVDLIDEAAARVRLANLYLPPAVSKLEGELARLDREEQAASLTAARATSEDERVKVFEHVARLKQRRESITQELARERRTWEEQRAMRSRDNIVRAQDVASIVSRWTGIPAQRLAEGESRRLAELESDLAHRVIGQKMAVTAVAQAVKRARSGLADARRPSGSFLFLGPTGVGKTELAKALAERVFGSEDAIVRIDMSEYMERHAVSRLIGAPPGYVGHEEGGQLTEKVRRRPYSLVLLDEIEKAHPEVFNLLLQVLDDGRLTDSKGKTVNFTNTIVIMTSNIGASRIMEMTGGTSNPDERYEDIKETVTGMLRQKLPPEFLNRIDEVIVFHALSPAELTSIVRLEVAKVASRLAAQNVTLECDERATSHLARSGYDPQFGARPLRRAIQREMENKLADLIIKGDVKPGDTVAATSDGNALTLQVKQGAGGRAAAGGRQ